MKNQLTESDVKKIEEHLSNLKIVNQDSSKNISVSEKKSGRMAKLKDAVKKAVNCCIE